VTEGEGAVCLEKRARARSRKDVNKSISFYKKYKEIKSFNNGEYKAYFRSCSSLIVLLVIEDI
jgi:hypothetical protein